LGVFAHSQSGDHVVRLLENERGLHGQHDFAKASFRINFIEFSVQPLLIYENRETAFSHANYTFLIGRSCATYTSENFHSILSTKIGIQSLMWRDADKKPLHFFYD
jgi:hypothetical protein